MIIFQRITTNRLNRIFLCFSEDLTATATAKIAGVNRNTVNRYFTGIREKIMQYCVDEYNQLTTDIQAAELHFEAKTVLRKKLKQALEERPILGLLKHRKKVFITVLEEFSHESLLIRLRDSLHDFSSCRSTTETSAKLSLNDCDQYRVCYAIPQSEGEGVGNDVKGIEHFLTFAKKRLAKFNGCSSDSFLLHLKECEFRYNHRDEDLFKLIKKIFQKY